MAAHIALFRVKAMLAGYSPMFCPVPSLGIQ
jgi:hypothetical protein